MDDGPEAIDDPEELARIRTQVRLVHANSALLAAGLTVLTLLIPT
ncbi:MAG: hypothetical protein ACN0LA_07120 [Candidatus Longimicrobiales bacterium M2_2A_002]